MIIAEKWARKLFDPLFLICRRTLLFHCGSFIGTLGGVRLCECVLWMKKRKRNSYGTYIRCYIIVDFYKVP